MGLDPRLRPLADLLVKVAARRLREVEKEPPATTNRGRLEFQDGLAEGVFSDAKHSTTPRARGN